MLLGVYFVFWWNSSPKTNINEASKQVFEIASQVRKHYVQKPDYWGLSSSNQILTNLFYSNGKLINALSKPILLGQGADGAMIMPGGRSFDVVYKELTKSECIALAVYEQPVSAEVGLLQITITNSEKTTEFRWGDEEFKLPISRRNAMLACKNGDTIIWTFE